MTAKIIENRTNIPHPQGGGLCLHRTLIELDGVYYIINTFALEQRWDLRSGPNVLVGVFEADKSGEMIGKDLLIDEEFYDVSEALEYHENLIGDPSQFSKLRG